MDGEQKWVEETAKPCRLDRGEKPAEGAGPYFRAAGKSLPPLCAGSLRVPRLRASCFLPLNGLGPVGICLSRAGSSTTAETPHPSPWCPPCGRSQCSVSAHLLKPHATGDIVTLVRKLNPPRVQAGPVPRRVNGEPETTSILGDGPLGRRRRGVTQGWRVP